MRYIIVGTHEFYGPETREIVVDQLAFDKDGNDKHIHYFDSIEDAEAFIAVLDNDRYDTMHNETGRPEYRVEPETWEQ